MGRRLDWDKAKWDSAKSQMVRVPNAEATETDIAEMDAVIRARSKKRNAAILAARKKKTGGKTNSKTHDERLARWKAESKAMNAKSARANKKRKAVDKMGPIASPLVNSINSQVAARQRKRNANINEIETWEAKLNKERRARIGSRPERKLSKI